jgi:mannose-6-phosphate isomerase
MARLTVKGEELVTILWRLSSARKLQAASISSLKSLTQKSVPQLVLRPAWTPSLTAQLWMGTHPNNPAHLYSEPTTLLSSHIAQHPELLGEAKKFPARYPNQKEDEFGGKGHVPFLFKILTCKQALPLQIHPNVELAKKLHEEDPEQFSE